jgi:hypothetical protein
VATQQAILEAQRQANASPRKRGLSKT